jgi:AraC-like DNA-binding protein
VRTRNQRAAVPAAKDLLRRQDLALSEVAERVGYGSASTFSTAFGRYVEQLPGRYGRAS